MKIVIVIPTFNEAENISRLVSRLEEEFNKSQNNEFNLLIVDGNSPDGTAGVVKELSETKPFVHLLVEDKKSGLGAAYIAGFKKAIKELHPEIIVEMDADFQHDPKDLLKLINEIQNGYDYVIGSRFVKGGKIPSEWQLYRKLLSYGGNLFSKVVLGIYNVNDFTSGFKASRVKDFLDLINFDAVLSSGFAYKIDLLYRMHKLGAKIKEVPIIFGIRDRGISKMEKNNAIDSLKVVLTLRYNENKNFFRFGVVGFVGLFVDSSLFNILRLVYLSSSKSAIISGFIAILTTYILNNVWSFGENKITGVLKSTFLFLIYLVSSSVPIYFRSWLIKSITNNFSDNFIFSNIAFFIGVIIGLVWNYVIYSKIIWRKKN